MSAPYRAPAGRAGRCGRGHMHDAKAIGYSCCIEPCRRNDDGGSQDPQRVIHPIEVHPQSKWPNAEYERS